MTPELERAVANAQKVFARYSLNGRIIVCNCPVCVAPETERKLIRTPLSQMSSGLLAEYTHSAHGWDDKIADDFRYFLPRYLELIAAGDIPSHHGDVWDNTAGRDADLQIAGMLLAADWLKRRLRNSAWLLHNREPVKQAMATVIAWLLTAEIWQRLETACLKETDETTAELLSQAEGIIARNA
jgi:hypothetical protein